MRTIVYADGGCDPNPGPGGWGVVIQAPEGTVELCGGDPQSTNNRMELTAAIRALEHFPEGAAIEMRCDSQYVVKSVTEWIRGWKLKGWRTTTGPVKNVELMQRLDELAARRDVRWVWVKGHAGEAGNERADRLAAQGRRQALGLPPRPDIAPAKTPPVMTPTMTAAVSPAAPASPSSPAAEPAPRGTSIPVEGALGLRLARAAKQAGTTPQAYADEVLRLALDLGPDGLALLREAKARKMPAA
ncbi:ribonuclease HI [Methylobacterium frigidaeris]|uniref:Ribonuclease H n=1 Tax=Methylobacterium frigidaeris TaxID=2038277 RepID=A0AA37HEG9_9HYPH|nr:ribonuclease HI [Methylobacterium frigidaeris]PIK71238.1 ribonuclease HI [Methylobacterium frigidaeris]GJD64531.1 Ribonuclease H [Methylobacterium frigidaeris]